MTNTAPDPAAWAAREVGLSPGAPPAEVRSALLREVTRAGFVPPPSRQQAWQVITAAPGSCPPEVLLAEEAQLRGEVDDFAAAFFATPVAARQLRWQALSAQCAFSPPLAARLAALHPALGLDLRLGEIGNPRTAQLASHVAGLFVLAPAARAAQRQAVLRGMQADMTGWEEIARQLQAVAPTLATLEPTLLASILGWRAQQQRLTRLREGRQSPSRPTPRNAARAAGPTPKAPAAKGSGGRAIGWGSVILVGFVVRVCIGLGSHSSSNVPPPQQFQVPQFNPNAFENMERIGREVEEERRRKATEDLQRLIREMEENNRQVRPGEEQPWGGEDPGPPPKRDDMPPRPPLGTRRDR